ncbi:MAG: hypothetical protein K5675_01810 [Lachnospiraceae bacterium]|nr:hypothetical protein [Lachnospiraceae bacterium]
MDIKTKKVETIDNLRELRLEIRKYTSIFAIIAAMLFGVSVLYAVVIHAKTVRASMPGEIGVGYIAAMGGVILAVLFYALARRNCKG